MTLQVVIETDSKKEAKDIVIKNIQNYLDAYYIRLTQTKIKEGAWSENTGL